MVLVRQASRIAMPRPRAVSRGPWAVAYGYGMTGMDGSVNRGERDRLDVEEVQGLVYFHQKLKNFQDSSSYRIFRRMHGVLIIDKNKN